MLHTSRGIRSFALMALAIVAAVAVGQMAAKKRLDHSVYDDWKAIRGSTLSRDGRWLAYGVAPQVGDAELIVQSVLGSSKHTIPRGTAQRFTYDGQFLLATVAPPKADVDQARKDKKPPRDQPKNALAILNLGDGEVTMIERVRAWRVAAKGSKWVAYALEEPPSPPAGQKPDAKPPSDVSDELSDRSGAPDWAASLRQGAPQQAEPAKQEEKKEDKPQKKRDHAVGTELILRQIATGKEVRIADVADYTFDEQGALLLYAVSTKDGSGDGLYLMNLDSGEKTPLMEGLGRYQLLTLHKSGKIAFVSDRDDYSADQPSPCLYLWDKGYKTPKLIAKEGFKGIPDGWQVVSRGSLTFSESGKRLRFNTAPKPQPEPKDDTPEEDKVVLDIWHYRDAPLMSAQLLQASQERNRSYGAVAFLDSGRILQLEDRELPNVSVGDRLDADVALATTNKPYAVEASWDPGWNDVYLVDLESGKRHRVLQRKKGSASLSPRAKYMYWFDGVEKAWFARDLKSGSVVNLTQHIPFPVHDYEDDHPDVPGPFGAGPWLADDRAVIVYDEYDLWLCDPTGKDQPVCVTDGSGRFWSTRLRIVDLTGERDYLLPDETLLLAATNTRTMASGFYRDALGAKALPEKLIFGDCMYSWSGKAEDADVVLLTKQCFDEFPDLWLTDLSFKNPRKASDANPQMLEYVWGTAELVHWTSLDGIPLKGILVKPGDFDPAKRYPMIVYFYERMSEQLHRHRVPAPSASTINPTMFASNGYLVFMPDIPYKVGYPGESAVNAILPGVTALISRGYVDEKRIGIQGQSWGGYQVAYLITRTSMFAAASAGAPVSNMFSAYGGIRWGSGLVRQMQYEHGQSRIGATPWEGTLRYIENSPIFWADKVQTPLLIMHNDKDGAVPWYQGIEYFTALRRLEKPVWMLVYNNEDHNLTQRKNQKDLSVRLQQFFDHYLKGDPMPVWMAEGVPAVQKGKTLGLEVRGTKSSGG